MSVNLLGKFALYKEKSGADEKSSAPLLQAV